MTPDWSASPVLVPYADLGNPKTFNQYSYVANNSLNSVDPEGHFRQNNGSNAANYHDTDSGQPMYGDATTAEQAQKQAPPTSSGQAQQQNNSKDQPSQKNNQDQNQPDQPIQKSGGKVGGRQPKGERRITGKPEFQDKPGKLPKGVKENPDKPGQYQVKDPHTGNWVDKPKGWSPYAQKVGVGAAIVTGAVILGRAIAACFGSGVCELAGAPAGL